MRTEIRVLIVSSSEKGTEFFKRYLDDGFACEVAESGAEGRRQIGEKDYDVVLINCPLKDEFGTELAEEAAHTPYAGVLLLVRSDNYDQVAFEAERLGVVCLPKPVSSQGFIRGMRLAEGINERLKGLMARTESLREKMEEIKLVGRAKLLLVTKLAMTESEAHRYIEKQAMDRCLKRATIAMEIIKTYQN